MSIVSAVLQGREVAAVEIQPRTNLMKATIFFILFFAIFFSPILGLSATPCRCLCSLFYTRGGEKKLCADIYTTKIKCENWYHDIPTVTNKKACWALGESLNECKGNFKENDRRSNWSPIEGGRYHSCRFDNKI
jgi:hypothetical protein